MIWKISFIVKIFYHPRESLNIFCFEFLDNSTRLFMIMYWLRDVDTEESVGLLGRSNASLARFFASRFRPTTPVDRVLSFVVLGVKKAVMREQRFSALTANEVKLLIFKDGGFGKSRRFLIENDAH